MIYRFDSFFSPVYKLNAAVYRILHPFFIFFLRIVIFFLFMVKSSDRGGVFNSFLGAGQ